MISMPSRIVTAFSIGFIAVIVVIGFPILIYWLHDRLDVSWLRLLSSIKSEDGLDGRLLLIMGVFSGLFAVVIEMWSEPENIGNTILMALGIPALLFSGLTIAKKEITIASQEKEISRQKGRIDTFAGVVMASDAIKKDTKTNPESLTGDPRCLNLKQQRSPYVIVLSRNDSRQKAEVQKESFEDMPGLTDLLICKTNHDEFLVLDTVPQTRNDALLDAIQIKKQAKETPITPQLLRVK